MAHGELRAAPLPCTVETFLAHSPPVALALAQLPDPVPPDIFALMLAAYGVATITIRADAIVITGVLPSAPRSLDQARQAYFALEHQYAQHRPAARPPRAQAPRPQPQLPASIAVRDVQTVLWAPAPLHVSPRTAFLVTAEPRMGALERDALSFVPHSSPLLTRVHAFLSSRLSVFRAFRMLMLQGAVQSVTARTLPVHLSGATGVAFASLWSRTPQELLFLFAAKGCLCICCPHTPPHTRAFLSHTRILFPPLASQTSR